MNSDLNVAVAHERIRDLVREAEQARLARPWGVARALAGFAAGVRQ